MKIYCAHQISGLSFEDVRNYYTDIVSYLKDLGYAVLYPICGKGYLRGEQSLKSHGFTQPLSSDHAIAERDRWMVQQCDVFFLDLTNTTKVSIGCCMELAWAKMAGKHNVVVMEADNVHRHAFVLDGAHVIFETSADARDYLDVLINGSL